MKQRRFDRKRTGCNLKTGWCCMIVFFSCLNFALPILRPILRPCLPLPMLVTQGYSALFVSILSGESKELITIMKSRGYNGEKVSGMFSIRLVWARDHIIYDLLTLSDLLWQWIVSSGSHDQSIVHELESSWSAIQGDLTLTNTRVYNEVWSYHPIHPTEHRLKTKDK